MNDIELYSKLASLSGDLKKEADEFLDFLKSKMKSEQHSQSKKAGLAKGLIKMKDDFDEPLDDFDEYMES